MPTTSKKKTASSNKSGSEANKTSKASEKASASGNKKTTRAKKATTETKASKSGRRGTEKSQMTKNRSKAATSIKDAENVLALLKEDHRVVEGYFKDVKENEDANHGDLFKKIKAALDLHAHVEEVIFYPHLLKTGSEELKKIVMEGLEEHLQVKTLLTDLSGLKGSDKVFKAKLNVLIENVEHHVKEEEGEMFLLIEDELDSKVLGDLGGRIKEERSAFESGSSLKKRAA